MSDIFEKDICDWADFPGKSDLATLLAKGSTFTDQSNAPALPAKQEVDLPGAVIASAMKANFDYYMDNYYDPKSGVAVSYPSSGVGAGIDGYLGAMSNCLSTGFASNYYSDLQMNYYCTFLAVRQCYTYGMGASKSAPADKRRDVVDYCLKGDKSDTLLGSQAAEGAPEFKVMVTDGTFDSEGKSYSQADVFRYIMLSRTSAFDVGQQQRVVNEFWNYVQERVKSKKSVSDYYSTTPTNCDFRPWRNAVDLSDGKHCYGSKTYSTNPAPVGY